MSAISLIFNVRIIFLKRPACCMIFKMALPPLSIEPRFWPHEKWNNPLPALLLTPFFARSLTLVPRSLLLNRTETLATQASRCGEVAVSRDSTDFVHYTYCFLNYLVSIVVAVVLRVERKRGKNPPTKQSHSPFRPLTWAQSQRHSNIITPTTHDFSYLQKPATESGIMHASTPPATMRSASP